MNPLRKSWVGFFAALILCVGAAPSTAASPIVLTFEGLEDRETIRNFYNGGTGSMGSSGTNHGVTFCCESHGEAKAIKSSSNFLPNMPSGDTALYFTNGGIATVISVADGFNELSFYYSWATSASNVNRVEIRSLRNNNGITLATLDITPTAQTGSDSNFVRASVTFSGTARSVMLGGFAGQMYFDDITFRNTNVATPVPEPATMFLLGTGLAGVGAAVRRKRKAVAHAAG